MKRTFRIILSLSLVMIFALSVAACGAGGSLKIDKAESSLEDEDYEVDVEKNDTYNGIPVAKILSASNDKGDYIYIIEFEKSSTAKLLYQNTKATYDAQVDTIKNQIKLYEHILKEYEDDLKNDEIDELEDKIDDLEEDLEEADEEYAYGYNGKVFWYGTADAVEDAKG